MFRSSHFWFLFTFGDKNMKIIHNLCLHCASQDGQDRKKRKENHETKVTKIPKTKRRKYGMNKTKIAFFIYNFFQKNFWNYIIVCKSWKVVKSEIKKKYYWNCCPGPLTTNNQDNRSNRTIRVDNTPL